MLKCYEKQKKAIFTIVKDEFFFIREWYKYYSKFFNDSDIYVLNHETIDGSLDFLINKINIIDIKNDIVFDHTWLLSQVQAFQKKLLKTYHTVVFTEVDEFIIPKNEQLDEYLKKFTKSKSKYVTCFGVELLHSNINYDPKKLILEQKKQFKLEKMMNKTLITKVPLTYKKGFHGHENPNNLDQNLILLHLHYFDYIEFTNRAKARLVYKDKFEIGNDGHHNKFINLEMYKTNFWKHQTADYFIDLPKVI